MQAIERGNVDAPAGRLRMAGQEYTSRTAGRVASVAALGALPIRLPSGKSVPLSEVAQVIDTHEDERIRVRYNGTPGVRVSMQKQPTANTVDVADGVNARLAELRERGPACPRTCEVAWCPNQAVYVRQSLDNASARRARRRGARDARRVLLPRQRARHADHRQRDPDLDHDRLRRSWRSAGCR